MENILQNLVKIIIIGAFFGRTNVNCNRQFLARPPLPYYQNEDYYVPGFAPVYHDQAPIYYQEPNVPPPISYHNVNSYSIPQLFYQNENYLPPSVAHPRVRYSLPSVLSYKTAFQQSKKPLKNFGFPRVEYNKQSQAQMSRPQEVPKKKTEAFASNIIVKDEPLTPYYQDDFSKNYNDEDYSDNYSDESPVTPKPCLPNSPYRYFEAPKMTPDDGGLSLCAPHFQPNFGNGVYTVKMPITLLPSRFPPRVEQLIERIQNYFSTYTEQETPKPQNNTLFATTPQPATEMSSESVPQVPVTEELLKKNKTGENQQVISAETATLGNMDQVTEKTVVVAIETMESSSTAAPYAQVEKESQGQMEAQMTQSTEEVTDSVPVTEITEKRQSTEGTSAKAQDTHSENSSTENRQVTKSILLEDGKVEAAEAQRTYLGDEGFSSPTEDVIKVNAVSDVTPTNGSFQDVTSTNG